MLEYIELINIIQPDGQTNTSYKFIGSREPIVEYLGGSFDFSEYIQEIYISGQRTPYIEDMTINFISQYTIHINRKDEKYATSSSHNGFHKFIFKDSTMYMYINSSKITPGSSVIGGIRIININNHTNLLSSPIIASFLEASSKQDPLTLTEKSNGNIVIGNLQGETKEFMPATPSGDPMHMSYVSAGAVWDDVSKTWSANGKSGLSNSEVRTLYNNSDMEELLFRKLWNAVGNNITNEQCKPRYDEETGFYRANGVWHIGYEEALNIYANNASLCNGAMNVASTALISNKTTLPCMSGDFVYNYNFVWLKNLVDIRLCYHESDNAYEHARSFATASTSSFKILYCYNLRIIRDCIYSIVSSVMANFDRVNSLIHVQIFFANKASRTENLSQCPNLSYFSLYTMLNKTKENQLQGLKLHENVYNLIMGNANSEDLGMEPITPEFATYKMIPYQRNLKIIPENALWREELDIKGINGEYIYPSFAEYLAEHPENFATSEDWQALATLAQEKGIAITT